MKKIIAISMLTLAVSAQAQTKVTSAMFGTMEARQLGPGTMSGRITAIEGVNKDDGKTIYIGTGGGGVWKSTNAGASYKSLFDKYCQSIGALAINQKNPAIVYVGTGESNMRNSVSIGNGLYKTSDGGDNWKKIGLDSTEHISKIIVHPTNPDVIYVAVPGALWSNSKHRGLYKSTNAGETWEKLFYIDDLTGCADVLMDPTNPDILFVSMWQFRRQPFSFNSGGKTSGLYKSLDGGKTWKEIKNGLPEKPFGRIAMAIAPSDPKQMLAIVESNNTGLYISSDGGESWKSQSATMNVKARPFYFSTLVIDPKNAKRVYRPGFYFAYSDDGGYSFSEASGDGGWVHSDMHALWINPSNTNIMYLGTDGGIYVSIDRGATWQFNHSLPVGQFYHVACDLKEPYNVYGGLQDNGSWTAPSAAPGGIGNANWDRVNGGDGFWTVPDVDGKTVYSEYQGGNMFRTNLSTMKAELIQPQKTSKEEKLRWNWNTPIVTGAKNPKNLYVGAQYLYKSTDQGRNWKRLSADLTTNNKKKQEQEESGGLSEDNTSAENHCTIFTIAESPLDENLIWVGTDDGNLQYSTDAGTTWTNVSPNIAKCGIANQAWVSSIQPSQFDKNTLYATFDNHMYGDHNTYLGKSTDMGKTWKKINSTEFTGFAHKIKEDLENKNLLFLGTEMGLFATLDGGENWFRMKNNMPEYALVRDIQIHPKTHDLIVATHGRGIFILDDIRPMRSLTKDIWDQEVYLFQTPDITLNNGKFGYGGPEVSGGWSAENPNFTPTINYYLKQRLATGKVTVEIYDDKGVLLQSMPGTIRKGINKVSWNLRGTPPKVAEGSTKMDGAGFTSPMVLPGTYTVKIKIKDKEYTSILKCIHDNDNKDLSIEDQKLVYEKATQLQNLYTSINNTIDSISFYQQSLKADTVAFAKNKNAQAFYKDLQKVKAEFMATTKTSIFADEEKLREKVSKLYGTFCGMESKPNSTHLESIDDLTKEYATQDAALKKVITKNLPKNPDINKKKD
ncbi:MAG TPA: glycosyl hydrolase, partial [Bacteroidia bacterium]|nr:glycosyl hydrolase [Bacteroidia bacterium]